MKIDRLSNNLERKKSFAYAQLLRASAKEVLQLPEDTKLPAIGVTEHSPQVLGIHEANLDYRDYISYHRYEISNFADSTPTTIVLMMDGLRKREQELIATDRTPQGNNFKAVVVGNILADVFTDIYCSPERKKEIMKNIISNYKNRLLNT